jgi:hypothetical protein
VSLRPAPVQVHPPLAELREAEVEQPRVPQGPPLRALRRRLRQLCQARPFDRSTLT